MDSQEEENASSIGEVLSRLKNKKDKQLGAALSPLLCATLYALRSMRYTLCATLYALHSMRYTLYSILNALDGYLMTPPIMSSASN